MKTICQLIEESLALTKDEVLLSNLTEIQKQAEKMEDRLLKYCNAIEDLGFTRVDRDYGKQ